MSSDKILYCNDNKQIHPMQDILNSLVIAINQEIAKYNFDKKLK